MPILYFNCGEPSVTHPVADVPLEDRDPTATGSRRRGRAAMTRRAPYRYRALTPDDADDCGSM
eukprot:scaffold26543_cov101-Isochrysis_galbana.AAC.7